MISQELNAYIENMFPVHRVGLDGKSKEGYDVTITQSRTCCCMNERVLVGVTILTLVIAGASLTQTFLLTAAVTTQSRDRASQRMLTDECRCGNRI
jgi:hypothetical protein